MGLDTRRCRLFANPGCPAFRRLTWGSGCREAFCGTAGSVGAPREPWSLDGLAARRPRQDDLQAGRRGIRTPDQTGGPEKGPAGTKLV